MDVSVKGEYALRAVFELCSRSGTEPVKIAEIAARQQLGWGSLISFELRGGKPAVNAFVDGIRHFALAESLGGVESLVSHPWTMTHASMDAPARTAAGIGEGLLRLSVGIEAAEDLEADLDRALDRALDVWLAEDPAEGVEALKVART